MTSNHDSVYESIGQVLARVTIECGQDYGLSGEIMLKAINDAYPENSTAVQQFRISEAILASHDFWAKRFMREGETCGGK